MSLVVNNTLKFGFINFWNGFDANDCVFEKLLSMLEKLPFDFELVDPMVIPADFVFESCFYWDNYSYKNCVGNPVKIMVMGEAYDLSMYDFEYSISFDSQTSTNLYYPLFLFSRRNDYRDNITKPLEREFCSFVVSNDKSRLRNTAFKLINDSYKHIASGGRYMNNVGGPVENKIDFIKNYKFNLCFENTYKQGYITEKIFDAFRGYSIPIYYGGGKVVSQIFNPNAFINCAEHDAQWLLDTVKEINENDELYLDMLNQPIFNKPSFLIDKDTELYNFLLGIFETHFGDKKN